MGKGSIGDSLGCILMEVFSLIDLQNSSISGEGNGTKPQKLDPERISALIVEIRVKNYISKMLRCPKECQKTKYSNYWHRTLSSFLCN